MSLPFILLILFKNPLPSLHPHCLHHPCPYLLRHHQHTHPSSLLTGYHHPLQRLQIRPWYLLVNFARFQLIGLSQTAPIVHTFLQLTRYSHGVHLMECPMTFPCWPNYLQHWPNLPRCPLLVLLLLPLVPPTPQVFSGSVAMAIANVFSKNGYTVPNKNAKILKIFERLKTLKSRWVISRH